MRCSHCGTEVEDSGEVATCPRCTRPILPRGIAVSGQMMPAVHPHVSSPVIVVAAPQPLRRLEAGGWFSRGFSGAGGVLVAMFAAGAVVIALLFGGWEMLRNSVQSRNEKIDAEINSLTAEARRLAMPHLRKRGIVELADDSVATRDGNAVAFMSQARDESGKVCKVFVMWEAGTFGGSQQWQLKTVAVDDDAKFFK